MTRHLTSTPTFTHAHTLMHIHNDEQCREVSRGLGHWEKLKKADLALRSAWPLIREQGTGKEGKCRLLTPGVGVRWGTHRPTLFPKQHLTCPLLTVPLWLPSSSSRRFLQRVQPFPSFPNQSSV